MKMLYFDCFSGISGDMTLGALLDLGLDQDFFINELKKLNVDGYDIKIDRAVKNGISAAYVQVLLDGEGPEGHSHDHDHHHSHGHGHQHRNLKDIYRILDESAITEKAKSLAKGIFMKVAEAEAKVHGSTPMEVHFHEVGAVDSIVDIVGAAILIDMLNPDRICASIVNDGYGFTYCQHGQIPVPVPAVMEIFGANHVKFRQIDVDKELVTPTGAAIVAHLSDSYGQLPEMKVIKTGYGAGARDNKIPNVLRLVYGETEEQSDQVAVLETNLDDTTGEVLGYVMERLFSAGAKDVFFTGIQMKKNRPGVTLTVLCSPADIERMEDLIFAETTTLGVRRRVEARSCLQRGFKTAETSFGQVTIKTASGRGLKTASLEFEEIREIASQKGMPLKEVYLQIQKELEK